MLELDSAIDLDNLGEDQYTYDENVLLSPPGYPVWFALGSLLALDAVVMGTELTLAIEVDDPKSSLNFDARAGGFEVVVPFFGLLCSVM